MVGEEVSSCWQAGTYSGSLGQVMTASLSQGRPRDICGEWDVSGRKGSATPRVSVHPHFPQ